MNNQNKPTIGFIGLGLMGAPMAGRLLSLGYPLHVIANKSRTAIDLLIADGATEAKSYADIAQQCDVIMLCLSTSSVVESVMTGPDGIIENLKANSLVIDFGTSMPESTRRLAEECKAKDASMLDAPLGRTPAHAVDGLLNIMTAGADEDFKRIKPVLEDLGENVYHVGPIGAGHTLKLINNFFGMTTACAMSEAFAMADMAGLKRDSLYEVMASGPLKSMMMDFVKANAVDGDKTALEFSIANAYKDLKYYNSMTDDFGVPSFVGPSVKSAFALATSNGKGDNMVSEMVDFFADNYSKSKNS